MSRIEEIESQLHAVQLSVASLESTATRVSAPQNLANSWSSIPLRTPSRSDVENSSLPEGETFSDPSTSGLSTPRGPISHTTLATTIFTEDYDLVVSPINGTDQQAFRYMVSKDVLSVSSSVLRPLIKAIPAPINDLGASTTARTLRKLDLDGDPEALRVIFNILHFNADERCRDIEFNTLCQIAILADKYQWQRALQTWSEIWLLLWEKFALDPGYENWIYISQVFNSLNEVERLVELLGKECSAIGVEGLQPYRVSGTRHEYLNIELWSNDLRNKIMTLRRKRIRHLCSTLCLLSRVIGSPETVVLESNGPLCESDSCWNIAYGSLMRSISQKRLAASSRLIKDWNKSAEELEKKLRDLAFDTLDVVVPEHKCALQGSKSRFTSCIAEYNLTLEVRMRRIFGDVVVYRSDRVHITDGL
ncbi:hypothetical protein TWF506_009220 [Arthrobotrys conoides]|uniref:Uncharacterized protein n=1 Tax=Arthrobotrys conoides TaxID=74498 RepID=A0AAN8RXM8_9PEZI